MEDQLDQIEKYLSGELSKEAAESFEKQMSENDELRNQVENHRRFIKGLALGFNRELKAQLQQEEQRLASQDIETKRRLPLQYFIGIAAAVTLILVSVFLLRAPSVNSAELFTAYYQPYPNIESPVSRDDNAEQNAYTFYEQGRYEEALDLFSQLISENPANPAPVFYSGICHLELDASEKAVVLFQSVQSMEKSNYSKAALWYEALASLKIDDKSSAVEILTDLSEGDDNYALRSIELLDKLKN
jgi:tetratricopeptide (TPR) repeat protein